MSTSGSTNFNLTRNQIITNALGLLKVVGAEETVSSADMSTCNQFLDMMIKMWTASGIGIWTRSEATLFLTSGTNPYHLGGASSSKVAETVVETDTSAASSSGATTITATAVTGMTAADVIGVVQDDGTVLWTTIVSINTGTKVITLTAALTDDVASGNRIYTYTTVLSRPSDVMQIRYRNDNDIDVILEKLADEDYFAISNKSAAGIPTSYYYSPQLNDALLYLWPVPNNTSGRIKFRYKRAFDDMDASANTPDFPQEWLLPLTYNLAVCVAPLFGKDYLVSQGLGMQAQMYLAMAKGFDIDTGSVFFAPNRDW